MIDLISRIDLQIEQCNDRIHPLFAAIAQVKKFPNSAFLKGIRRASSFVVHFLEQRIWGPFCFYLCQFLLKFLHDVFTVFNRVTNPLCLGWIQAILL